MNKEMIKLKLFLFALFMNYFVNAQEFTPPNILLINIDDLGWKDVGFMGSKYYETTNIDNLASKGMVFTNGYAAGANCSPSRASLMTGLWTPRHGIYTVGNSDRGNTKDRKLIPVVNKRSLSNNFKVIPQVLKENGYTTCHAGKWHLSNDPTNFGFDFNIGGSHSGFPKSYFPPYKNVDIEKGENDYLTDLITEKAIDFIQNSKQPFFLYFSPYAVHLPINPIEELLSKYKNKTPFEGQDNYKYATMIDNLDRNIGLLINSLEGKNNIIIFTSDNGGLHGITNQKPLRAGKGSYYEGGIRDPFIFVWKDKIKDNLKTDIPITNLDIFPTIINLANISYDGLLDGVDLSPILFENKNIVKRSLFWHFPIYIQSKKWEGVNYENRDSLFRTRPGSVVRNGNWKLHYYFEDESIELFNLKDDISEKNNLIDQFPKKTEQLKSLLENWWDETNAPIPYEKNPKYIITE